LLLREALGVDRAWLIAHGDQALTDRQQDDFKKILQRRLRGEPVAYILGCREFYGLEFAVTPAVLIPRPDTETLVETALGRLALLSMLPLSPTPAPSLRSPPKERGLRILDLGTGSGAIAISIALHRPDTNVTAVDRSEAALAIARRNTEKLGAINLTLLQSDWFSALSGEMYDIIVSNPPYIAKGDPHLSQGDLRFEPPSALASGADGLDAIRHIIKHAPHHLNTDGWLLLEHGYDQAEKVAQLMQTSGFAEIGHTTDLAGIQRVTFGKKLPGNR
jgi:release factor glutamine methyltransferase